MQPHDREVRSDDPARPAPDAERCCGRDTCTGDTEGILNGVMSLQPRLEIEYCTQCRWLLRAAWTAQEMLTTFQSELGEVALVPGTGGIFDVRLDQEPLWSRSAEGGFPDLAHLKRLVRDRIAPGRDLGHSESR
jgi:selenoprotein W-related protein